MVRARPQRSGAAPTAKLMSAKEQQEMRQVLSNVGIRDNQLIQDPGVTKLLNDAAAKGKTDKGQPPEPKAAAGKNRKSETSQDEPQKSKAATSKKRKSDTSLEEISAEYKQNLDDRFDPDSFYGEPLPTPGSIRGRINRLLDSGIMTKKEFCEAINTTNASLNNFLAKTGTSGGMASTVVDKAAIWFKQRDLAGLKLPSAQKRQKLAAEAQADGAGAGNKGAAASKPGGKRGAAATPDISQIHLEGEETDEVPVYDTCDEVRRKITAHFKATGMSQAQFCRDIYAQLHHPRCASIQSKQLSDFRGLKGARRGVSGSVFYAAYVYFEKLRIAAGKPKTKHRQTMEDIYGYAGFNLDDDGRQS